MYNKITINMTSNNDSGYVATASSTSGGAYDYYHAFDGSFHGLTGTWQSDLQANPYWIKIQLPASKSIKKYIIYNRDYEQVWSPDTVRVYGSNNDTDYDLLDTLTGISNTQAVATEQVLSSSTPEYLYYKIEIDNDENYCCLGELELYEEPPSATATVVVGGSASGSIVDTPVASATVSVSPSALAVLAIPTTNLFYFVYSIQQSQASTKFSFVYSIEQPKTATIIERINT